jgi:antitoxin MazE
MHVQVTRWGNSLGVRLPRALAKQIGIDEGQKVSVRASGDKIIIEPLSPHYRLEDLLTNMSPDAMRGAFAWGPDAGREAIDG